MNFHEGMKVSKHYNGGTSHGIVLKVNKFTCTVNFERCTRRVLKEKLFSSDLHVYEFTTGIFIDSHTYGDVQHHTVQGSNLSNAIHEYTIMPVGPRITDSKGNPRELITVKRIN